MDIWVSRYHMRDTRLLCARLLLLAIRRAALRAYMVLMISELNILTWIYILCENGGTIRAVHSKRMLELR